MRRYAIIVIYAITFVVDNNISFTMVKNSTVIKAGTMNILMKMITFTASSLTYRPYKLFNHYWCIGHINFPYFIYMKFSRRLTFSSSHHARSKRTFMVEIMLITNGILCIYYYFTVLIFRRWNFYKFSIAWVYEYADTRIRDMQTSLADLLLTRASVWLWLPKGHRKGNRLLN